MRRLAALVVALLLVTGCAASSPAAVLQERANGLVRAANAGDASATRTAAELLLQEVKRQDASADLPASKAQALVTLITRILANAGLLDETGRRRPSPTFTEPTPTPTPSPEEPSPTPSPESPSPEPSQVVPSIVIGDSGSPEPSPAES